MALRNAAFITQPTDVSEWFLGNCQITLPVLWVSSLLTSHFHCCHLCLKKAEADSLKMAKSWRWGSFIQLWEGKADPGKRL